MPKLGETMEEGEISRWLKREGEKVEKGEPLFEVTTDKANFEVESPASGFLRKILFKGGDTVAVTRVIGYIADSVEEELPAEEAEVEAVPQPARAGVEEVPSAKEPRMAPQERKIKASPLARRLAQERGIDLTQVKGTGPGGRITRADVENFQPTVAQAHPEALPLTGMRKTIARRLSQSKREAPHYYLQMEIDMSEAVKLRQNLLEEIEKTSQVRLSYTDLIIKATALALKEFPLMNSTFEDEKISSFKSINICIAVALDQGLVAPVIKEANKRSLAQIAGERTRLASRAKDNKLTPEDISGGTFTISNLGPFGVDSFIAIINPPQVGILAVGRIRETAAVTDGAIGIRSMMNASLSLDHRVIDGAYGAGFLSRIKELLERPYLLIMERTER